MNTGHEGINFSLTKKKAPSYQASLASRTHLDAKGSQRVSRRLYWKHPFHFSFLSSSIIQSFIKKLLGYAVLWSPDEHVKVKDHVFSQKLFGKSLSPKGCTILWENVFSVTSHEEYWSLYPPQCTQTATSPWWGDKKGYWLFHSSRDPIQRSSLSAIPDRCFLWSPEAQEGDFPGRVDAL